MNKSLIKDHTLKVEIDGEEIQAEYSEIYHEYSPFNKSLNLWDKITIPFYRIKNIIRDVYWEIRYGFQRMFKGYDYVDTFETFAKFTERYYKILNDYKNHHNSHPFKLTEEEWNNIIDDMLRHLYYMDEENVEKELSKDVPENWTVSSKTTYEIMEKHKNEFFKLFSEYFFNIWD